MARLAYNVIRTEEGVIVAVADAELLNRKLTAGNGVTVEVSEDFFGGKIGDEEEVSRALAEADMAIIVGARAFSLAKELGLVAPGSEIYIGDVPYVQIFRSLII